MNKIIKHLVLFLLSVIVFPIFGQIHEPVKWSFTQQDLGNDEVMLVMTAKMAKGWHLYSQFIPEGGPIPTSFQIEKNKNYIAIGKVSEPKPITQFDKNFNMDLQYFNLKADFKQKIKKNTDKTFKVKGTLEFMTCDDEKCLPPDYVDFEFVIKGNDDGTTAVNTVPIASSSDTSSKPSIVVEQLNVEALTSERDTIGDEKTSEETTGENNNLWAFFLAAILGGFIAILTPCVFPMIPMTVSFFMNDGKSKALAKLNAVFYGLSIIAIYTLIGTLVAVTLGADFANFLSTHWIPNVFFFLIFLVFAASFFGAFEMTLPSWMITKTDQKADKGGFIGSFFMAFTLVLVSFSCTAPIVGTILVASAGGEILKPIIGMLGFSLAFALPFTLFALFPSWLNSLPKSGGWLNSVKVVLGFIEVALGLKFLSIADQTYHWGILDREIYLASWIIIFTLLGFYLLGKIKFKHDSDVKHIGIFRLSLVIITFTFVMYMIPGMWGAPLKALSGYLPPQTTQDFDISEIVRKNAGVNTAVTPESTCIEPKYGDFLHLPHGLEGYFEYEQALVCAKKLNKPLFIDFTGHGCVNCREMEARVWSHPEVLRRLRDNFVVVALYVDDKKELPESGWIVSSYDGKTKKTIGQINANFQITRFNNNAQPYYVLLDTNGDLLVPPKAYDLNIDTFIKFLDSGIEAFKAGN
ncbi:MAG: protein-disulfide reductase DsbD family protein [Bacteroidales bacterium]|nr:protein-disulfide reductase DsbD family protein [Bacteroidales bacterium]